MFPAKWRLLPLLFLLILALVACGDAYSNPTPNSDSVKGFKAEPATNNGIAANGEKVFYRMPCLSCHTLNGSGGTEANAPALDKIGITAATRVASVTAAQYIRHILIKPEDASLPNYRKIMPGFANSLSTTELDDLVAYLLTLK